MRKTNTGRWQPDLPPKPPQPPRKGAPTFDMFLHHMFTCDKPRADCPFCYPPPPEPPWELLNSISLGSS